MFFQRQLWTQKYACLRLGDLRYSEGERLIIAKQLVALPECCARHGLTRGLRNWAYRQVTAHQADVALAAAQVLVAAQRSILRIAGAVRMSIAHVENNHKLHKDILHGSKGRMSMSQLFAGSVNERTSRCFRTEMEGSDKEHKVVASEARTAAARGLFDHVKRRLTPMEVFIKRKYAGMVDGAGMVLNPVRLETKRWLRDEWDRCSIAEQVRCEELSELTDTIAKHNRSLSVVTASPSALTSHHHAQLEGGRQVVPVAQGITDAPKIPVHWADSDTNALLVLGRDCMESLRIDVQTPMESSVAKEPFGRGLYLAFRRGTGAQRYKASHRSWV